MMMICSLSSSSHFFLHSHCCICSKAGVVSLGISIPFQFSPPYPCAVFYMGIVTPVVLVVCVVVVVVAVVVVAFHFALAFAFCELLILLLSVCC